MKDPFLVALIERAKETESATSEIGYHGIEITLCVGGMVVSGELISETAYGLELSGKDEAALFGSEDFFAKNVIAKNVVKPRAPDYIHLANAHLFVGNNPLPEGDKPVLWRGRLESIDGFHFGRSSPSK